MFKLIKNTVKNTVKEYFVTIPLMHVWAIFLTIAGIYAFIIIDNGHETIDTEHETIEIPAEPEETGIKLEVGGIYKYTPRNPYANGQVYEILELSKDHVLYRTLPLKNTYTTSSSKMLFKHRLTIYEGPKL